MKTSVCNSTTSHTNKKKDVSGYKWILPVAVSLTSMLTYSGFVLAAKGGTPGPPPGGETANNLSLPAVVIGSETTVPHVWSPPDEPVLGVHYSYGCDLPETDDKFSYPNTSCVDSLSEPVHYWTADQCIQAGYPCEGFEVTDIYRIYWQKVSANEWWADDEGAGDTSRTVAYVDWGDALEAVTPNDRSFIRVETQPYHSLIPGFDPIVETCENAAGEYYDDLCKVGLQMWHVSGQGITEHWGVRAEDTDQDNRSYNYDSPFQIIKSNNVRLNLTKMAPGDALCAEPGGNPGDDPPEVGNWDPISSEWSGTCTLSDQPYSVELSVGGKYVYGYNWRLRDVDMSKDMSDESCQDWLKTGFWRLTFYVPMEVVEPAEEGGEFTFIPKEIIFDDALAPNVAPPASPAVARTLPRGEDDPVVELALITAPPPDAVLLRNDIPVLEDEDPDEDDRLYVPVIDPVNNLTYIDICVTGKKK